jgi:mannose-1-phosphate guanylyltransferase
MEVDIKKELKIFDIKRFVEKPTKEVAIEMISEGNYLWNSGIFLFNAKDMASAYKEYCPDIFDAATDALDRAEEDLDFLRLDPNLGISAPIYPSIMR